MTSALQDPRGLDFSDALPTLRDDLHRFVEHYGLTPREHDLLFMLVTSDGRVPGIAKSMRLSPNTVHNHFKNLYRRTRTTSKSDLVALLYRHLLAQRSKDRFYIRRPRVLLLGAVRSARRDLESTLERCGMHVMADDDEERARLHVHQRAVDVVVARAGDCRLLAAGRVEAEGEGLDPNALVVAMTQDALGAVRDRWLVLPRLAGIEHLVFSILEGWIGSPYEISRLRRVQVEMEARVNEQLPGRLADLGLGGAFVWLSPHQLRAHRELRVGSNLDLEVLLPNGRPTVIGAEVVWMRPQERPWRPSGLGLKFSEQEGESLESVRSFVRTRKVRQLLGADEQLDTAAGGERRSQRGFQPDASRGAA